MNQLSGKYVNIVLSVECGRGMDFLKNSVHVSGNFNGRILESDKIPVDESPTFNTELVWEADKKDLRKARSANQPLRVECICTDGSLRKERLGFALLSLRSAQIIPKNNSQQELRFTWYKLIGCQTDKRKCHPELYLSLALRDHLLNDSEACQSIVNVPLISEEDDAVWQEEKPSTFPLKYFEDGHIQVGEGENQKIFCLNIFVKDAVNLDALLPEILVFQQNRKSSFLCFKVLGTAIKTKPFLKDLHNTITVNEKIVVNLMSNRDILEEFFSTQSIPITFFCGPDRLGVASLEFDDIFTKHDLRCFFKFPSPNGIVPFTSTEKSPYIDIQAWIEENVNETSSAEEICDKPKTKTIFSNVSRLSYDSKNQSDNPHAEAENQKVSERVSLCLTKSVDAVIADTPSSPTLPLDKYQKYMMQISLKHLVWKTTPSSNKVMFKFQHPKAASCISIFTEISTRVEEVIKQSNIAVKLGYISTPNKIAKLLTHWPPRLVLTDETEVCMSEEHVLGVDFSESLKNDYEITVRGARNQNPLATIAVSITFKVIDVNNPEEYEQLYLLPIILDEVIVVKEICGLQMWKADEKKRFDEELEEIKKGELERLDLEWGARKGNLESQLTETVKRCQSLQGELRDKLNSFRTERALERKASQTRDVYLDIFTDNWKKYCDGNTKELIEELSKAQRDNMNLKDMLGKSREKLAKIEKSVLTKTQTTNLLQELRVLEEKFEETQNAKRYFKEQWQRACEEIHELRTEDLKNVQLQLRKSKEQLSQLSLEKYEGLRIEQNDEFRPSTGRSRKSDQFMLDD